MKIRRYYKRGIKYDYTWSDEYFQKMIEEKGEEVAIRMDNASYDIVLESDEEERSWFFDSCNRVLNDTRWYLDNIDKIPTFRINYSKIFPRIIK